MKPLAAAQTATAVDRIDGTETINGKTYFKRVVSVGLPGAEPIISYQRSEGLFTIDARQKELGEVLAIPFPLVVGKTWTVRRSAQTKSYSWKVESLEALELLDRQIKDCLKLSYSSSDGAHGLKWLAKGVGMVKQVHHAADGMTMEYVLQKYER
jgi:hypothetical protein